MDDNIIMPERVLNTAVLFLIFNRPDTTKQVFEAIRRVKPPRLYVAADGPRFDSSGEGEIVEQVRKIATAVDWPCEVKTLFRKENLGCKYAVSGAINWFFEYEDSGIILEDDVLPGDDFFYFIESGLNRYKHDCRVSMITGMNHYEDFDLGNSYFFSEHYVIWGWGTWKRVWNSYDVEMTAWSDEEVKKQIKYKCSNFLKWMHYKKTFDTLAHEYTDTWDIQWVFTCFIQNGLCVTPGVNLISNIGVSGAHSSEVTKSHFKKIFPTKWIDREDVFIARESYDMRIHRELSKDAVIRHLLKRVLRGVGLHGLVKAMLRKIKNK
jgi:hypothetical protein